MFDSGSDGVPGHRGRVHNNAKAFNLKVGLIQGFKGASIIEVMVKGYGEVGVCDGGDKCGIFSRRWE